MSREIERRVWAGSGVALPVAGRHGFAYRHPYFWAPFVMYGEWR